MSLDERERITLLIMVGWGNNRRSHEESRTDMYTCVTFNGIYNYTELFQARAHLTLASTVHTVTTTHVISNTVRAHLTLASTVHTVTTTHTISNTVSNRSVLISLWPAQFTLLLKHTLSATLLVTGYINGIYNYTELFQARAHLTLASTVHTVTTTHIISNTVRPHLTLASTVHTVTTTHTISNTSSSRPVLISLWPAQFTLLLQHTLSATLLVTGYINGIYNYTELFQVRPHLTLASTVHTVTTTHTISNTSSSRSVLISLWPAQFTLLLQHTLSATLLVTGYINGIYNYTELFQARAHLTLASTVHTVTTTHIISNTVRAHLTLASTVHTVTTTHIISNTVRAHLTLPSTVHTVTTTHIISNTSSSRPVLISLCPAQFTLLLQHTLSATLLVTGYINEICYTELFQARAHLTLPSTVHTVTTTHVISNTSSSRSVLISLWSAQFTLLLQHTLSATLLVTGYINGIYNYTELFQARAHLTLPSTVHTVTTTHIISNTSSSRPVLISLWPAQFTLLLQHTLSATLLVTGYINEICYTELFQVRAHLTLASTVHTVTTTHVVSNTISSRSVHISLLSAQFTLLLQHTLSATLLVTGYINEICYTELFQVCPHLTLASTVHTVTTTHVISNTSSSRPVLISLWSAQFTLLLQHTLSATLLVTGYINEICYTELFQVCPHLTLVSAVHTVTTTHVVSNTSSSRSVLISLWSAQFTLLLQHTLSATLLVTGYINGIYNYTELFQARAHLTLASTVHTVTTTHVVSNTSSSRSVLISLWSAQFTLLLQHTLSATLLVTGYINGIYNYTELFQARAHLTLPSTVHTVTTTHIISNTSSSRSVLISLWPAQFTLLIQHTLSATLLVTGYINGIYNYTELFQVRLHLTLASTVHTVTLRLLPEYPTSEAHKQ
ncbi:hypothetical protein J6590_074642 [Homalodisca vitripennis]|nr:hypothetical protein J6590_074642 [Homalodisca vitripennis]